MRLRIKRIGIAIAALLIAIPWVPVEPRNPAVNAAQTIYAMQAVPANVRMVFEDSCKDCHSK